MSNTFRKWIQLIESAVAPKYLYHGTSVINAASIAASHRLLGDASHDDPMGVSFTRSERLGWEFAGIADEREMTTLKDNRAVLPEGRPSMHGVLLVLDGDAMRKILGNRLRPYIWNQSDGIDDEEEERFHGSSINIEPFLISVLASPHDVKWWAEAVKASNDFMPGFTKHILAMERHPAFRAT